MTNTTYYNLKKPGKNDNVLIDDLNDNADAIDQALHGLEEHKADLTLSNLDTPQLALANLGAGVRPILLINPFFQANQRGIKTDIYTKRTSGITIEPYRYSLGGRDSDATFTVEADGLLIDAPDGCWLTQKTEYKLSGETITLSVLTDAGFFTGTGVFPGIDAAANTVVYHDSRMDLYLQRPSSDGFATFGIWVAPSETPLKIHFFKPERGSGQTACYKDGNVWKVLTQPNADLPTQLALCQRYAVEVNASHANTNKLGIGNATTTTEARILVPVPAQLRTKPAVTYRGGLSLWSGEQNTNIEVTNVTVNDYSAGTVCINVHVAGGLIVGESYLLTGQPSFSDDPLSLFFNAIP